MRFPALYKIGFDGICVLGHLSWNPHPYLLIVSFFGYGKLFAIIDTKDITLVAIIFKNDASMNVVFCDYFILMRLCW
jgi:hypothetical protein